MAESQRLYRTVLDRLLKLIDSGEYPAGGRLPPERELAERFDVSRPTIREAIIALEVLGRVQVKTGSGVYILEQRPRGGNGFDDISPFELTEARALIEGEAVALAAAHITPEELLELERSLHEMAQENEEGDLDGFIADAPRLTATISSTRAMSVPSLSVSAVSVSNSFRVVAS